MIKDWGLEGKTFSLTIDNASSMDVMITHLKSDLHSSFLCLVMVTFFTYDVVHTSSMWHENC